MTVEPVDGRRGSTVVFLFFSARIVPASSGATCTRRSGLVMAHSASPRLAGLHELSRRPPRTRDPRSPEQRSAKKERKRTPRLAVHAPLRREALRVLRGADL